MFENSTKNIKDDFQGKNLMQTPMQSLEKVKTHLPILRTLSMNPSKRMDIVKIFMNLKKDLNPSQITL